MKALLLGTILTLGFATMAYADCNSVCRAKCKATWDVNVYGPLQGCYDKFGGLSRDEGMRAQGEFLASHPEHQGTVDKIDRQARRRHNSSGN